MLVLPPVHLWDLLINVIPAQRSWLPISNSELNRVAAASDVFNEYRDATLDQWISLIILDPSKLLIEYDQA